MLLNGYSSNNTCSQASVKRVDYFSIIIFANNYVNLSTKS